jgi:uncharacterized protein YkwD
LVLAACSNLVGADDKKEPPKLELSDEEKTLLELTNKERADKKLPPLEANPILFKVARAHSANMAKQGKMEHVLDGKTPAQRVDAAGYDYARVAENIAWADGGALEAIVKGWMDSKLHRDNILNGDFKEIGIGIGRSEKGELYFTQVFAAQRKKK